MIYAPRYTAKEPQLHSILGPRFFSIAVNLGPKVQSRFPRPAVDDLRLKRRKDSGPYNTRSVLLPFSNFTTADSRRVSLKRVIYCIYTIPIVGMHPARLPEILFRSYATLPPLFRRTHFFSAAARATLGVAWRSKAKCKSPQLPSSCYGCTYLTEILRNPATFRSASRMAAAAVAAASRSDSKMSYAPFDRELFNGDMQPGAADYPANGSFAIQLSRRLNYADIA